MLKIVWEIAAIVIPNKQLILFMLTTNSKWTVLVLLQPKRARKEGGYPSYYKQSNSQKSSRSLINFWREILDGSQKRVAS